VLLSQPDNDPYEQVFGDLSTAVWNHQKWGNKVKDPIASGYILAWICGSKMVAVEPLTWKVWGTRSDTAEILLGPHFPEMV
jgi:hypothetical protein